MAKTNKQKKLNDFLKKHKKAVIIYNVLIWLILLIMVITYNAETSNYISREEMQQQIKERCSNEIKIPKEAYNIKFNYNPTLNITTCEVITK